MAWGCKQLPNGCGWASWIDMGWGEREWWCDLCERSGQLMVRIVPRESSPSTEERYEAT